MTTAANRDLYDSFDAEGYLSFRFSKFVEANQFLLKHLSAFYSAADSGLKVLDYGCGPCIGFSISAATKAAEIVLVDYSKPNTDYLKKWLSGDANSGFDWTPIFKYVVQTLEGGTEEDAKQRKDDLRSKVKAVAHCDVLKDEFIDKSCKDRYDVVMCFLCLDSAVPDKDYNAYKSSVAKLSSLLKEGGQLLFYSTRRENCDEGFYFISGTKYSNIVLKRDFVVQTLRENGFVIEVEDFLPLVQKPLGNTDGFIFISARKVSSTGNFDT